MTITCSCPSPHPLTPQGHPHLPPLHKEPREPFNGASPGGNETAENNFYFSFFGVSKG